MWRTPAADTDPNPLLPASLMRQLTAAFTGPGTHVVDLTGGLLADAVTGRAVHVGVFDDGDITIPAGSPEPGSVALVAVAWPPPNTSAAQRGEATATLLYAARRWLATDGVLVLLAGNPPGQPPADYGPLVAAAAAAGLGYLQHIAAVRTPVIGAHITTPQDPSAWTFGGALDDVVIHLGVHADVFAFAARDGGRHG
ncbi:hypothetical protein ACLQ24_00290 [Micromonospora sp. DT4]|uniref:hypothetical protein n=1 Tax=Micromonospora sp. DT4 TaxID=3393438 RepID=UPI003CF8589E